MSDCVAWRLVALLMCYSDPVCVHAVTTKLKKKQIELKTM